MQTEPAERLELAPDATPPVAEVAPAEPTPVLAYSSRTTLTPRPTVSDVLGTGVGITLTLIMLAAAGMFMVWIFQCAMDGWEFAALALLAPLGLVLIAARRALRIVGKNLPGARLVTELRGEEALREWRDIGGGIFTTLFGLTMVAVMLFVIHDLLRGHSSTKKIVAVAMILIVLLCGIRRSFQSAWRQLGGPVWRERRFCKSAQEDIYAGVEPASVDSLPNSDGAQ